MYFMLEYMYFMLEYNGNQKDFGYISASFGGSKYRIEVNKIDINFSLL